MTRQPTDIKKATNTRLGAVFFVLLLLFSLALLLRRADVAANCMREGLALCARAVVPSLFPFMVLSELLVTSGAGEWLTAPLARPLGKLLGLSRAGCCAVTLGLLCGFPIGARCAILSYEKGTMERNECERALACSSIPSSAFLISTVGTTLWKDATFGVALYLSSVFSALLGGFLLYVLQKSKKRKLQQAFSSPRVKIQFEAEMFSTAVKKATMNILLICAYVIFFSTLAGAAQMVLDRFFANEAVHAILASFLELSGGVSAATEISNPRFAKMLTGAAVGWSGLSIHCQMLSLCDGHDLSTRPYLVGKIVQAVTCATIMTILK